MTQGINKEMTQQKNKEQPAYELPKAYLPADTESKWYTYWLEHKFFHAKVNEDKKPYTIVIPPPNITGVLHMGHALNNTIQDVFIRWKRMQGFEACWIPGTDHAGIATQHVVERNLRNEGKTRHELGREKFLEQVWEWKEKYGSTIIKQLQKLGTSCDWDRERFTMDEGLSSAVKEVFIRLYEKGLIYRGNYIVNWCPNDHTALSDDEVNHSEVKGNLWYISYPVKNSEISVTVATTRPETMLGDTAVAVNPKDERYKDLIGKIAILPIVNREIPIIGDEFVDPQFGTGLVKVTPAHDPNDFEIGLRHNLKQIIVMDTSGRMNENVPEQFRGTDRYKCRKMVLKELEKNGYLEHTAEHVHMVGKCYRCDAVIEPYLSDQWFVKMKPLAEPALKAVLENNIRFHPKRWIKTYDHWMSNIRDWCISRQLWWGHRIPVYYCNECDHMMVLRSDPETCQACNSTSIRQDEDVLDTWFSSWLWPFSTLGWPEENDELRYFYPTDTLVTGPDIIFFWVARMIMAGLEFRGEVPFTDVYFTSIIRDIQGRKMSKSLGNSPDPLDVIDEYGADALRFTLLFLAPLGQDVFYSNEKCEIGRNFANKLWNAGRFLLMNKGHIDYNPEDETLFSDAADEWIESRLNNTITNLTRSLDRFNINESTKILYDFVWRDFCDWYLEMIKYRFYESSKPEIRKATIARTIRIFETSLRMLHPFMPFITEELWSHISGHKPGGSIMIEPWPKINKSKINPDAERQIASIQDIITSVRSIRGEMNVPPGKDTELYLKTDDTVKQKTIEKYSAYLKRLAKISSLVVGSIMERPSYAASAVVDGTEIFVPLKGIIDIDIERKRITKEIDRLEKAAMTVEKKLLNEQFLSKAPKEVIDKEKNKLESFNQTLEKHRETFGILSQ
jgi:valyl-tRNA synthetase